MTSRGAGRPKLSDFVTKEPGNPLDHYRNKGERFNHRLFKEVVWGDQWQLKEQFINQICGTDAFDHMAQIGQPCLEQYKNMLRNLAATKPILGLTRQQDDQNCKPTMAKNSSLYMYDTAFGTFCAVHQTLYYDCIMVLGSEKHRRLQDMALTLEHVGCFCMTEIAHGSNVSGIETTATYDPATREFVLNSPSAQASKAWIGALGRTANMAAVFVKLIVNGEDHGVHVLAIEIRDYDTHTPKDGCIIGNLGEKVGLNGIDNGFMYFNNYRVPYDALLDRFSSVTPDGKYKSSIKSKEKRFGIMMSGLHRGRIGVFYQAQTNIQNALTIALRYAAVRRQFGPDATEERRILDYPLHRYRLMPHLANCVVIASLAESILNSYQTIRPLIFTDPENVQITELHIMITIFKPLSTMLVQGGLQECREACGGHGYLAKSRLGWIRDNNDATVTWEGDNNIILQSTSRFLLKSIRKVFGGAKNESQLLTFLDLNAAHVNSDRAQFDTKENLAGNSDVLTSMLAHWVNYMLHKSLAALQENVNSSKSEFDGWQATQVHFLNEAAVAFGYYHAANIFFNQIQKARGDAPTYGVFLKLYELFVLTKIEKYLDTFRERDYMSWEQGEVVKARVRDLTYEIGESSLNIIESIAAPDRFTASCIGKSDGQLYANIIEDMERYEGCYADNHWFPAIQGVRKMAPTNPKL